MSLKRSRLRLPHKEYKVVCNQVHERDGWRCKVCKRRNDLHAHHIVFRSHGGDDASWNLVTLCTRCHDALHERHILLRDAVTGRADKINADNGVAFEFINGWKPSRTK